MRIISCGFPRGGGGAEMDITGGDGAGRAVRRTQDELTGVVDGLECAPQAVAPIRMAMS